MTEVADPTTARGAVRTAQSPAGPPQVTPIPAGWVARMLAIAARASFAHRLRASAACQEVYSRSDSAQCWP